MSSLARAFVVAPCVKDEEKVRWTPEDGQFETEDARSKRDRVLLCAHVPRAECVSHQPHRHSSDRERREDRPQQDKQTGEAKTIEDAHSHTHTLVHTFASLWQPWRLTEKAVLRKGDCVSGKVNPKKKYNGKKSLGSTAQHTVAPKRDERQQQRHIEREKERVRSKPLF